MVKKTSKSRKVPEKSISDKVNHYKGIARTVKKRMENLEKRVQILEQKMAKVYIKPDEVIEEKQEDCPRKDFLKKWKKDE